ncbi:MAG TPA: rhomboid family intramembrane serine protease [Acidimicrobiales bacterium]|nr:rhomboid family intramembrane serine protease [Acidimicrobiales bacterium]
MLPLSDGVPTKRFPIVNTLLIVANVAVWLFYELPDLDSAVTHASFYPCTLSGACHGPEPWGIAWFTAMFLHASWGHIAGNMLFLAVFGNNVEDALGRVWYFLFYVAGGFVAAMTQTAMTLLAGTAADARVPTLGASGAIAAVLGAYIVFYPNAKIFGLIVIFPVRVSAWFFLGAWFIYQLIEANVGLLSTGQNDSGGVAFFAHVGGFVFGYVVARIVNRNPSRPPSPTDQVALQ